MWQVRRCTGFVFLVAWPPGEIRALNPSGHRLCQPTNSKPVHCANMIDICIYLSDSCRYDAHRIACRVAITLALFSDDLNVVPRHHSDLRVPCITGLGADWVQLTQPRPPRTSHVPYSLLKDRTLFYSPLCIFKMVEVADRLRHVVQSLIASGSRGSSAKPSPANAYKFFSLKIQKIYRCLT